MWIHMSAPGLMFNGVGTIKRARPRRRWRDSEKGDKNIGIPCVSCMGPNASRSRFPESAHGYRKCIKKHGKTKQICVSVAANGYASLSARWGRTPERYGSQCETLGNHCKTNVFHVWACTISIEPLPPANGFKDLQTVIENVSKPV